MVLDGKPLQTITEDDLQSLVSYVRESKVIDYKEARIGNARAERVEFLADVSSFANASGGHMIIGMKELQGLATELGGFDCEDSDAEIARLENMIRDSIEPRIPQEAIHPIQLRNSKFAFVIRVARSWNSPHRITLEGHDKFYSRNSNGKYALDVSELRAAFRLTDSAADRIRSFRIERLANIVAGESPVWLENVPKTVLHIVPFGVSDPSIRYDVASFERNNIGLQPIRCSGGYTYRHNLDGFVTYAPPILGGTSHAYVQVFRNGSIEAVDISMIRERRGGKLIPAEALEEELINRVKAFLEVQKRLYSSTENGPTLIGFDLQNWPHSLPR